MKRSPLGQSPLQVSALGLGTWAMGGTIEEWGPVDDRESIAAIHQALDLGINLIDTAPIYGLGHAEGIVGKAIRSRRDEVVLVTQCGLLFPKAAQTLPTRCLARDSILRECEDSLRRMRTDVIDLYQCHWPDPNTNIRESMEAMTTLLEQGKIRAIGLSNFGCERLAAAREFGPVHCVQLPFSLLNRRANHDLLPDCIEHQTGVLAYSPLAKGLLSGTLGPEDTFEGIRGRDPDFVGSRYRHHLETVDALQRIAARYEKTVAQLAIHWVAMQPGITAPIFGAQRPSHVVENAGAIGWQITEEDQARINHLIGGLGGDG